MLLHELVADGRREGQPDEESYARLSARAPYGVSTSTLHRSGSAPKPEDLIHTAWGTTAYLRNLPDPPTIMAITELFGKSPRTVGLAALESALGIPMFEEADQQAEAVALLPRGWHTLTGPRMAHWHRTGTVLVEDQDREAELERLRAENRKLKAELQKTKA